MFRRLNTELRKLIALAGALFLVLRLIAGTGTPEDDNDGFQTKEFDDIW